MNPEAPVLIALGNAFRADDGVGEAVLKTVDTAHCTVVRGANDSLALLNAWADAPLAILIDAAQSGAAPGTIQRLDMQAGAIPHQAGRCSSHGLGLAEALQMGQALGRMPRRMVIYAVEGESFVNGEGLSPAVAGSVPKVAAQIDADLATLHKEQGDA